jgi:hypothetical protein
MKRLAVAAITLIVMLSVSGCAGMGCGGLFCGIGKGKAPPPVVAPPVMTKG